jgi:hypothetical protein
LDATTETHPDYEPLSLALKLMSDVSTHLNEHLKLLDRQKLLSDLYKRLAGKSENADHLIQPHRRLISRHSMVMYVPQSAVPVVHLVRYEVPKFVVSDGVPPKAVEKLVECFVFNDMFLALYEKPTGELDWVGHVTLYDSFLKLPFHRMRPIITAR